MREYLIETNNRKPRLDFCILCRLFIFSEQEYVNSMQKPNNFLNVESIKTEKTASNKKNCTILEKMN